VLGFNGIRKVISLFNNLITKEDIAALALNEKLIFNDEERISILESKRSIDVQACPGSGKTTLIAAKLILLAKKWPLSGQGVCVLSHTNVAKNEVIERLKKSKTLEAQRLLSYPHFIGTIQEFTNRFLALPLIRTNGVTDINIDNDEYLRLANELLEQYQFSWLRGTLNGLGGDDMKDGFLRKTFRLISENGVSINISKTPRAWKQPANLERARRALNQLKDYLDKRGYYLYRDMYTYAQLACNENSNLCKSLSARFPCVFVDEMQDTQKFQDDLLRNIFPLDNSEIIVQRFGDPDQSIFHGTGYGESNDCFNKKSANNLDFVVDKSHRFDGQLAGKIKPLSHNGIPLESELTEDTLNLRSHAHSNGDIFEHSIIVFNDDTRNDVIRSFGDIVSEQFHEEYKTSSKFVVKALGAVGNEIDPNVEQLKIGHYWDDYEKNKAKNNFKESSLIESVRYCRQLSSPDFSESYNLLFNSFLKLLWKAKCFDEDGRRYTRTSLQDSLKADENLTPFRKTLYFLLSGVKQLNQKYWSSICEVLTTLFDLDDMSKEASQYLKYREESLTNETQNKVNASEEKDALISLPENMIKHPGGFDIHLSTIHGVKGETHDATLVMETKNYSYDIEGLLNHIASIDDKKITQKRKIKFSRQLYVAASRPRYLLCLAIHEDRISQTQRSALDNIGWCLHNLSI
jgi:superfamily I DNA/RNA helicase